MCVNMYLHVNEYACVAHLSVRNTCVSVCARGWVRVGVPVHRA